MDTVVIIPTYNNARTIEDVIRRSLAQGLPVMVVNDGCTDETSEILQRLSCDKLFVVNHLKNQGKGAALRTGFAEARKLGFAYAVTLDADGQHFPEDIPLMLEEKAPDALVVGSRGVRGNNGGSRFANGFSNFWFTLFTWVQLPDTQTGYRLYPLERLPRFGLLGRRYEAELSILLLSAWKGLRLVPVQVRVDYPPERVSHFRPLQDFTRISCLYIVTLFAALFYGYPRMLLSRFFRLLRRK